MTDRPRSALLVIDMQIGLVEGAYEEDHIVSTIAALLEQARAAGQTIVHVQHDHVDYKPLMPGEPTWKIDPRLAPRTSEPIVHKHASDAFYKTELESVLHGARVGHLIITGMQTEFCIDSTVRSASSRGFDVTLVADGHTTGDADLPAEQIVAHHNQTLANLAQPDHPVRVTAARDVILNPL